MEQQQRLDATVTETGADAHAVLCAGIGQNACLLIDMRDR